MEIFVRNLPTGQKNRTIKRAIANAIRSTFRDQVEFDWQFTKRRDSARLTLPTLEMSLQFLTRFSAGLPVHGNIVRFSQSRNQPDPRLIEGLQRVMVDRGTAPQGSENDDGKVPEGHHMSPREDAHYTCYAMEFKAIHWGIWTSDGLFGQCGTLRNKRQVAYNSETGELELIASKSDDVNETTISFGIMIENIAIEEFLVDRYQTPSRLYITLNRIPRFWSEDNRQHRESTDFNTIHRLLQQMFNALNLDGEIPTYRLPALSPEHATVAPYCTVYAVDLEVRRLERSIRELLRFMNRSALEEYPRIEIVSGFNFAAEYQQLKQLYAEQEHRVSFQMESLVRNCLLLPAEVMQLHRPVQGLIDEFGINTALRILQNFVSRLPIRTYEELSQGRNNLALFEESKKYQIWIPRTNSEGVFIHRVDLTPAAYNMDGPEWMGSNRVLRLFPDHHDHFLKVSFVEENLGKIQQGRDLKLDTILHDRWSSVLQNGLEVCGRVFRFLGFSSSSLKEHSVWFLSPFEHEGRMITADAVRSQLGDFSHIRCPPRMAARIGQTFTTTTHSFELDPTREVRKIQDVSRGGYIFSDGVGTISKELLESIWKATAVDDRAAKPVVYQIRLGGAKGVLSLDTTLRGRQVCLRPAMTKFEAPNSHLELANKGSILQFFLNRQLIVLLESLGLPGQNLIDLQDREVNSLELASRNVEDAKLLYARYHLGVACDLSGILDTLLDENVDEVLQIPFFHRLNNLALSHALKQIKFRSRVPVEDSWVLIGVMDEFNFLGPKEIYVCLRDDKNGEIRYLKGDALVTRSPALHCGDIQKVFAIGSVDESHPLSALYNCVVFSSQGLRPIPNMLGGGDLDGDIFSISQNPFLFPPTWETPGNYEYVAPVELHRDCTMEDVTKFFLDFIVNDNLGQICARHQILADREPKGALHPNCIELSKIASIAMDFPKTGRPADLRNAPWINTRVKPDFMAYRPLSKDDLIELNSSEPTDAQLSGTRPDRQYYYESKKVLGQMYRRIEIESLLHQWDVDSGEDVDRTQQIWLKVEAKLQQIVPSYKSKWPNFVEEAQEVFDEYMNELQMIQRYYHPTPWRKQLSEVEVFLQCISVAPSIRTVRGRGAHEYVQGLRQAYEGLVGWVRSGVGNGGDGGFQRLAAYFYVGIHSARSHKRREGESFAWIVFKDIHKAWQKVQGNGFVDDG